MQISKHLLAVRLCNHQHLFVFLSQHFLVIGYCIQFRISVKTYYNQDRS